MLCLCHIESVILSRNISRFSCCIYLKSTTKNARDFLNGCGIIHTTKTRKKKTTTYSKKAKADELIFLQVKMMKIDGGEMFAYFFFCSMTCLYVHRVGACFCLMDILMNLCDDKYMYVYFFFGLVEMVNAFEKA